VDVSESEGGRDFRATKAGERHRIRIDHERYEIADPAMLGG